MSEKDNERDLIPEGVGFKPCTFKAVTVGDADLEAINRYALEPLTRDKVFAVKVRMCDNVIDRQHEKFSDEALEDMKRLFEGRTVLMNHRWVVENQVARIFRTEVEDAGDHKQLNAWIYMLRGDKTAGLIENINAGIVCEGSVGFLPGSLFCSICGTDNVKSYCRHWGGMTYAKDTGEEVCVFTIGSVVDAYEWSFVAVPVQRAAGVTKGFRGARDKSASETAGEAETDDGLEREVAVRLRLSAIRRNNKN